MWLLANLVKQFAKSFLIVTICNLLCKFPMQSTQPKCNVWQIWWGNSLVCHNSYYLYEILNYKSFKYSKNGSNSCYLCGCKVACHIWCAYLLFLGGGKSCLICQCTHVIIVIILWLLLLPFLLLLLLFIIVTIWTSKITFQS